MKIFLKSSCNHKSDALLYTHQQRNRRMNMNLQGGDTWAWESKLRAKENSVSLEIGDKVKLNPNSKWNDGTQRNPLDVVGEVIGKGIFMGFRVDWGLGAWNGYNAEDLIKQENDMGNKVGELITDWDSLEVGDKAVFVGYTTDNTEWRYTVGKLYTAQYDEEGDFGFVEDVNELGYTSGCPDNELERFNFRLISKANKDENVTSEPFPEFGFKIRNGDNSAVRQWLEDNGVTWIDGESLTAELLGERLLLIEDGKATYTPDDDETRFDNLPYQEIKLHIQPAVVVGYEVCNDKRKKEIEDQIKELMEEYVKL